MGLLRVLVLVLLGAGDVWGQDSIRPDQTFGLRTEVRADSLGKNYSEGAVIDTMHNWGSVGGVFRPFIGDTDYSPRYRGNIANGLPAVYFESGDGVDHPVSLSTYKFLHDGSPYTILMVVKLPTAAATMHLLSTNGRDDNGGSHGIYLRRATDNKLKFITSSPYINIDAVSSLDVDDTESVLFFALTFDVADTPDFHLRINGAVDTTQNYTNSFWSSNHTANMSMGITGSSTPWYLLHLVVYDNAKSADTLAMVLNHLYEKWAGTTFPGTPQGLDTTSVSPYTISLEWNKVADAGGGYKLYRRPDPSHYQYPAYQLITSPSGANDTTFSDVRRLPGIQHKYKVRATNDTLNSNHSNIVDVTTDVPVWLHPELLLIENGLGQKWADTTFHFFESIPGLGAQQVRRRGMARARAGQQ